MPTTSEKREEFRRLHESGCFVIANPWDTGSTRYLQGLGFKALATTSAGGAWSLGYADGAAPLDAMLDHIRQIVEASDVPVNADFLEGFAVEPDDVAANVRRCVETGVAGLSIEDATGDPAHPFFAFDLAVERIRAARAAIDDAGGDTLLVGRAECFRLGAAEPLKEAIRRLTAFAEAGADCLYAPGATSREDIAAIVAAVSPKPVNVVARGLKGLTVADLAAIGVRRISTGALLASMAWAGFDRAAREVAGAGTFTSFEDAMPGGPLDAFFKADAKRNVQ